MTAALDRTLFDHDATVVALVAQARSTPSVVREALAAEVTEIAADPAVIVIHTCHRVELYVAARSFATSTLPTHWPGVVCLEDLDAVRHLIAVACGLESAVLGENQILHQLREQFTARHAAGSLDPVLDRLFQVALRAGRRAHGWFGGQQRSLADVALERIAEDRSASGTVLVVGAGIMGRLAARAAAHRDLDVIVTSRTASRAEALAHDVGGTTIPFAPAGSLPAVDGVVVALAGQWPISPAEGRRLAAGGATVVDLSSPPAVDHRIQQDLGSRFVSVDDLAWGRETALEGGLRDRLERLISDSGLAYCRWLRSRESLPAIQAIACAAEGQRQEELDWLFRRLPGLDDHEQALIEQMSRRLVSGMLHAPRAALNADTGGSLGEAALELFGL